MKTYHSAIKSLMIEEVSQQLREEHKIEQIDLLDLACGRANDLHKWNQADIHYVLGLDLDQAALTNAGDGAVVRYHNMRQSSVTSDGDEVKSRGQARSQFRGQSRDQSRGQSRSQFRGQSNGHQRTSSLKADFIWGNVLRKIHTGEAGQNEQVGSHSEILWLIVDQIRLILLVVSLRYIISLIPKRHWKLSSIMCQLI